MAVFCEKCSTPLEDGNRCVTCDAEAEGLRIITRSGYASVREMMALLEAQGLGPEMEKVPPSRPEEVAMPLWNLYVPEAEVQQALTFLRKDWAALLEDPEAAAAADRGLAGIDVDKGGEVTCPACGHAFTLSAGEAECPECGLVLGAPSNSAPDEVRSKS